tara:strand:+ start:4094 stop:4351 length:258 start_codon:yes stop_codon:yes gene_type:complete
LPDVVARVADFIGLDADDETLEVATPQSRFDFMKAHAGQFDDNLLRRKRDAVAGLPSDGESNKVATSQSGKESLSEEIKALLRDV